MAPFDLNGLNVVHQDIAAPSPDFTAHLDLWTNLPFESDEPLASSPSLKRKLATDDDDDDDDDTPPPSGFPSQDSHENTVHAPTAHPAESTAPLDLSAILSGFGIDPLLMPTAASALVQQNTQQVHPVPSLAQLLAIHAAYSGSYAVPPPSTPVASTSLPKRARTQKTSPVIDNPISAAQSPEESSQSDPSSIPLSAAEDKRRRNTAASARFRLKKKEREVALERRAKELEERVVELERECEALRRENGWLKGLVVGVTGAGAAQHQQASAK